MRLDSYIAIVIDYNKYLNFFIDNRFLSSNVMRIKINEQKFNGCNYGNGTKI